jgi:hypothetical protein
MVTLHNPFTVGYSSSPASSQRGSDPSQTKGGIFDEYCMGYLPGANFGKANDEFLICNTHSDGPNIAEENGGIGVFNVAQYFARVPQRERPKSMVFMAATGHFGHGLLSSGRDWINRHPQIIAQTVGCMTIEHFGCNEWSDLQKGRTWSSSLRESRCSQWLSLQIRRSREARPGLPTLHCARFSTSPLPARSIALPPLVVAVSSAKAVAYAYRRSGSYHNHNTSAPWRQTEKYRS